MGLIDGPLSILRRPTLHVGELYPEDVQRVCLYVLHRGQVRPTALPKGFASQRIPCHR